VLIYLTIYLALRKPIEIVVLSLPPISLGISALYIIYVRYSHDLLTDTILFLQIMAGLAIARFALKGRRVMVMARDIKRIMLDTITNLKQAPYILMISLGLTISIISIIDLIVVFIGISQRAVLLINPVTIGGVIVASILTTGVSEYNISRLVLPAASWGAAIYLYPYIVSEKSLHLLSEDSFKSIEIPGVYVEKSSRLRISMDTSTSPHIVISGNTGSGKTTLCKILADSLRRGGVDVIVIDYHGEYRGLSGFLAIDASEASPQILPSTSTGVKALELVDSLRKIFRLGALQVSILSAIAEEAIRMGGKSFKELLAIAEEMLERSRDDPRNRELLLSIIPYLRVLATHIRGDPIDLEPMLSRGGLHAIFDMSNVGSEYASTIYVEYLLKQIWRYKMLRGQRRDVDLVVIIDEAHNLLKGSTEEFISRIFKESRKYGLSIVISTQQFEKLPLEVVNNTNIFFFLRQTDPRVIDRISSIIATDNTTQNEVKSILRSLEPLQGLIYIASKRILQKIFILNEARPDKPFSS
jgi:DNA helicase HerA-like ATPase